MRAGAEDPRSIGLSVAPIEIDQLRREIIETSTV